MSRPHGFAALVAAGGVIGSLLGWAIVESAAAADAPSLDSLGATRARPLFSASRRPPAPALVPVPVLPRAVAPPPLPPPNVQLSGVILGADKQVALLKRLGSPTALSVAVGGLVEGWTVTAIGARAVVLQRNDRSVTVALPEPGR